MANTAAERREFLRIPFHAAVEINTDQFSHRSESDIDVSMSGLRVSYAGAGPAGGMSCTISLILQPVGKRIAIDATGKVVRSETGSIAVQFTGLDPDSFYHLRQLILNNARNPEKAEREFDAHWGIRRPKRIVKEPPG